MAGSGATGARNGVERPGRLLLGIALSAMAALAYLGARERSLRPGAPRLDPSPEQEAAVALELGGLDPDPTVQRMSQEVGRRLSAAAPSSNPFDFQVLADTRTANAFALPGGRILITRALYSRLDNEAELAGVLAHEIAHVVAGHAAHPHASAPTSSKTDGPLTAPAGERGALSTPFLELEYDRSEELAADAASVELMSAAGYDPRALISVVRRLAAGDPGGAGQSDFARTHPDSGDRGARISQEIDRRYPGGVAAELTTGASLQSADPS
jgi:predicted Zn-dependent protease